MNFEKEKLLSTFKKVENQNESIKIEKIINPIAVFK